uniref:Uncharacterized protein n=1 Tax=Klebsiella phage vB-Kvc-Y10 TaxID=3236922 RepID=A0AB39CBR0_9CAUD
MIKSKRRINKRELVEGSRTDRAPSYWETMPWFIHLCKVYGRDMAIKMGLDARRTAPGSWVGDNQRFPVGKGSVVVWAETSYFELWMKA